MEILLTMKLQAGLFCALPHIRRPGARRKAATPVLPRENAIAAKGNSPFVHCTRGARFAPQRQEHVAWRFPVVLICMPTSLLDARTQHVVVPNNLSGCFCAGSRRSCFFTGGSPGAFLSPVADRELVSISGSVTRKNSQVKVTSSRAKQLGQALQSHICAITRPAPPQAF